MNRYVSILLIIAVVVSSFAILSKDPEIPVIFTSTTPADTELSGFYIKEINNGRSCEELPGSTSFITFGDTQPISKEDLAINTKMTNQIAKQDYDLIIHTGDHVENGAISDAEWEDYFNMISALRSKPYYGIIGNHDAIAYDSGASTDYTMWNKYWNFLPNNHRWYSFDEGGAHFIILDSISSLYLGSEVEPEQKEWLESDLPNCEKADYCFVFMHVPAVSWKGGTIKTEDDKFTPLFKQYGVDAIFSGHVHVYERGNIGDLGYIVSGGGGGKFHEPANNAGYNAQLLQDFPYEDKDVINTNNFVKVSTSKSRAVGCIYDINGNIIDSFEIGKR